MRIPRIAEGCQKINEPQMIPVGPYIDIMFITIYQYLGVQGELRDSPPGKQPEASAAPAAQTKAKQTGMEPTPQRGANQPSPALRQSAVDPKGTSDMQPDPESPA